ncbi:MAG: Unknown protein [uncultured Sulfurovum sp.]|uniref:Type II secretion system protein n=1 Tax=uncultured Sulfurovum sp. TaxID=269237 RepID=A0A6S6TJX5_9BACT|nr:MAG: Unknown protein [uncultured Sulfurovum sp.]
MSKESISIKKSKPAIAMIELIFALVIIGIVLLSSPMLIQQSIRSSNVALQQEAIAAAAAQTGVILSMNWDEANANLAIGTSPILDTQQTITPFNFNAGSIAGLKGVSGRISLVGGSQVYTPSPSFGPDLNSTNSDMNESDFTHFDDVDDYANSNLGITVYNNQDSTADIGDYVDIGLNMHTKVSYRKDAPVNSVLSVQTNIGGQLALTSSVPSNIKHIKVALTSKSGVKELDKNISLEAFSCNIGTFEPQGEIEL